MSANRLEQRLDRMRAAGRRGIAPYVTAGDGGLDTTLAVVSALDAAGAAFVELGVPFSDPIADGPILQAAADRALRAGTTLARIFGMVEEFRRGSEMPLVVFSYANPLLRQGWDDVCRRIAEAGADGLLVPDLPVEEGEAMRAAAAAHDLCPTFFVAPTTSTERIRAAAAASRGFLYAIGRFGVTGGETVLDEASLAFLGKVRSETDLPLAVGFGIRTAEQVHTVTTVADLAIVGSALVQRVHEAYAESGSRGAAEAAGACLAELSAGTYDGSRSRMQEGGSS